MRPITMRPMTVICALVLVLALGNTAHASRQSWPNWGNGPTNNHHATAERRISEETAALLDAKWTIDVGASVSAVAAVADGRVHFPDWVGNVWCVDARDGSLIWKTRLDQHTGIYGDGDTTGIYGGSHSRNGPAIAHGMVYLGDLASSHFFALRASDGALVWKRQLDAHPLAVITQSATVHDGRVLVGVSSNENTYSAIPDFPCCTFRGSMVALDALTGELLWQTYMTPYTGASVWGSSPAVDVELGLVYVGTGNNYLETPDVAACRAAGTPMVQCALDPENHVDSMVALRVCDGSVEWARSFAPGRHDAYNLGCAPEYLGFPPGPNSNCPNEPGEDADFGQAPMLISYTVRNNNRIHAREVKLVGAGQKNGKFVALDRATGALVWTTKAGPGGVLGGAMWGAAFDGERIYVSLSNSEAKLHNLTRPSCGLVERTYGGLWVALDPATGDVVWETPVPAGIYSAVESAARRAHAFSPLTVANGVVFAGATTIDSPNHYALDATTGRILWNYASGGPIYAAPAVVDSVAYWGCGYRGYECGTFSAFALPRRA